MKKWIRANLIEDKTFAVVGVTILVLGFIGTAIWNVRTAQIENLQSQINAYEKSTEWKLPETLKKINDSSQALALNINERKNLTLLNEEVISLRNENGKLTADLDASKKNLERSISSINEIAMRNDEFSFSRGSSFALVNNKIYISLKSVGMSSATGIINDANYDIDVGRSLEYKIGGIICKVVLLSVQSNTDTATFSRSCINE